MDCLTCNDYLDFGESYYTSAEHLKSLGDDSLYSRLYLYSHSAELGLKTYIYAKSGKCYRGHKLHKLMRLAKKLGFVFSDTMTSIIFTFNEINNSEYRTRYLKSGPMSFPNQDVLTVEILKFFKDLRTAIAVENSHDIHKNGHIR